MHADDDAEDRIEVRQPGTVASRTLDEFVAKLCQALGGGGEGVVVLMRPPRQNLVDQGERLGAFASHGDAFVRNRPARIWHVIALVVWMLTLGSPVMASSALAMSPVA